MINSAQTEDGRKKWIDDKCKFTGCYHRLNCQVKTHTCAALHNLPENKGKIL